MLPLPTYDADGRKVVLTRPGLNDPSTTSLEDVIRACMVVMDVWLLEDEQASVTASVMVEDCEAITLAHMTSFTPVLAKKASTLFQVLIMRDTDLCPHLEDSKRGKIPAQYCYILY